MSNKRLATFYWLCAFFSLFSVIFAHILPPGSRHNSGHSFESSSLKISQSPLSASFSSSSSTVGGSTQQQAKYPLSFPPTTCTTDMDCIGRNASSRLYFDPFGRCDTVSRVCACREGYHRVQLRVKSSRGRRALAQFTTGGGKQQQQHQHRQSSGPLVQPMTTTRTTTTTIAPSTALPISTSTVAPVYISKCVPDSPMELEAFLRSTSQHYYGRACLEDRDCEANLICRPLNPAQSRSRNLLPPGAQVPSSAANSNGGGGGGSNWNLYANRTKRCRCPNGQHWNKHSRRCEWPAHYEGGSAASGNASPTTGTVVSGGSSPGYFSPMSIDLKLFEIVLEVAFLIACLLGYRACSKNCCRDDESHHSESSGFTSESFTGSKDGATSPGSDGSPSETCDAKAEVKSDEESIISRRSSTLVIKSAKKSPEGLKGAAGIGGIGGSMKLKKSSSGRVGRKRRSVGRFCRRDRTHGRSCSPYGGAGSGANLLFSNSTSNFRRLSSVSASMSRSSSASTRNLLVKLNPDDAKRCLSVSTTLAPPNAAVASASASSACYNCRIYKEVYSPTARCKSCRSSLASVVDDAVGHGSSLDLVAHGGSGSKASSLLEFDNGFLDEAVSGSGEAGKKGSLLLLPPYKQKPIRRSEEVGVPPHLRAPYRDSQPFWLK